MRVILDTNVFVSGVFFSGPPYQILRAWRNADWGAATAAIEQVLSHLERNINPTLALTNMILDVREAISPPAGGSAVSGQRLTLGYLTPTMHVSGLAMTGGRGVIRDRQFIIA